jgi:hypothetical protein
MKKWMAMLVDEQGLPRAWGSSSDKVDAIAAAQRHLNLYIAEKKALKDPLANHKYVLHLREFEEGQEPFPEEVR